MYRYSVDQAITYTSEDIVLFKESPFACWMERLTLENPDHGIPPDVGTDAPCDSMEPQDDLADTLRAEGKNVVLVEWELDEAVRRNATLEAMRHGTDFIVNGQLALGSLSGSANLLMRTSGYSELGNYLYVPCNTQPKTNLHSALRLCFLADLLHSLQGQLPPQMLIIRGGADVVPLQTEDHIYHYRAVKQRFMATQREFRKHKMPDPSESAHFGRWSDCANEVLKQRALRGDDPSETPEVEQFDIPVPLAAAGGASAYDLDEVNRTASTENKPSPDTGATLAEQARRLPPETYAAPSSGGSSEALENLAFIGSSSQAPTIGEPSRANEAFMPPVEKTPDREAPPVDRSRTSQEAPSPSLRNPDYGRLASRTETPEKTTAEEYSSQGSQSPVNKEPQGFVERRASDAIPRAEEPAEPEQPNLPEEQVMRKTHPLDSPGFQRGEQYGVDRDMSPGISSGSMAPPPHLSDLPEFEAQPAEEDDLSGSGLGGEEERGSDRDDPARLRPPVRFNSSLITGLEDDD